MARAEWIGVLALACLVSASRAAAHPLDHPKLLRLGLAPGRAVLGVVYDVSPGDASRRLRALFDRDGSGRLEPRERDALTGYLAKTATLFLRVRIARAPAALEIIGAAAHGLDLPVSSNASVGLSATLVARLPSAGDVRLELADRAQDGANHVPLTVDVDPRVELLEVVQGTSGGPSEALKGSSGGETALGPRAPSEGNSEAKGLHQIRDVLIGEGAPFTVRLRIAG